MPLNYPSLDETTRGYILKEVSFDVAEDRLYFSPWLNLDGQEAWAELLKVAAERHGDEWLATNLLACHYLNDTEQQNLITVRLPFNAAEVLADEEFNRFYIRGVCARADEGEIDDVEIFAGREIDAADTAVRALVGQRRDSTRLLEALRKQNGVDRALGCKKRLPSGLTVRLP